MTMDIITATEIMIINLNSSSWDFSSVLSFSNTLGLTSVGFRVNEGLLDRDGLLDMLILLFDPAFSLVFSAVIQKFFFFEGS